jgi:solute carrier family 25 carnitine/acylcarnitine transporter 20/29
MWFTTFEYLMNSDVKRNNINRKEIPAYKIAFYGGVAGEVFWLSTYPFDVIKSKVQSDGFGTDVKYRNALHAVAQTWKQEGWRGFWKGIGPTLVRAMPVSAGTFVVAEGVMRLVS